MRTERDTCGDGRPFRVDGRARLAGGAPREDWSGCDGPEPDVASLHPEARRALAREWTEAGLREHASIASFAQFLADLLAHGAPAGLVADAARALSDEVEHARLCFGVASVLAEEALGPGPLDMAGGVATNRSLAEVVVAAVRDGCVAETLCAIEAGDAAEQASDLVIRRISWRIWADELRHATLAWSFVAWAIEIGGREMHALVTDELCTAMEDTTREMGFSQAFRSETIRNERIASRLIPDGWGRLNAGTRRRARQRALDEVIRPCAARLSRSLDAGKAIGRERVRDAG